MVADQKFLNLALSLSAFDAARTIEYDGRVLEVMYVGDMTEEAVTEWLEGTKVVAVKVADNLFSLKASLSAFCPVLCQAKQDVFSRVGCAVRQTGPAIFASLQAENASLATLNSWPIQVTDGRDDREDGDPDEFLDGNAQGDELVLE